MWLEGRNENSLQVFSFFINSSTFLYNYRVTKTKNVLFIGCYYRQFARKKGRNNVTVDDLVQVITPKGRGGF